MTNHHLPPWASGPAEILNHGLELLAKNSDENRRLAMISIDNGVELIIKTYLGLPKRVNGLKISRSEYQEFAESFPKLLDALDKYEAQKLGSLDLGEIEWYHRLRNQLYHQGNGLTVERAKVEVYGQLAVALFESLFGIKPPLPANKGSYLLAEFISGWTIFERAADDLSSFYHFDENTKLRSVTGYANELYRNKYLTAQEYKEIKVLWAVRNQLVHGHGDFHRSLTTDMVNRLKEITQSIRNRIRVRLMGGPHQLPPNTLTGTRTDERGIWGEGIERKRPGPGGNRYGTFGNDGRGQGLRMRGIARVRGGGGC